MKTDTQEKKRKPKKPKKQAPPKGKLKLKEPDEYCNGRNKQLSRYCGHQAGWGTIHVGQGRCRLHGGATPTKHGLRSKIIPDALKEIFEGVSSAELKNLDHELARLKALLYQQADFEENIDYTKLSTEERADMRNANIAIIDAIRKHVETMEKIEERRAKRLGESEAVIRFLVPFLELVFTYLEEIVRNAEISRDSIPQALRNILAGDDEKPLDRFLS